MAETSNPRGLTCPRGSPPPRQAGSASRDTRKDALGWSATLRGAAAVLVGWMRRGHESRVRAAPTDRPRPLRACWMCACSPATVALRVPLWEEV